MKIAFCYKGTFNIDYIKKYGIDKLIFKNVELTINNNIEYLFDVFKKLEYEYDIFLSTYNIHDKIDGEWIKRLTPKDYYCGEPDYSSPTIIPQLDHFKRLINMINLEEEKSNQKYDLLIFTRLDIMMLKKYDELNIDCEKFNIILKNESGGCDDNFFVIPRKYFNQFIESVDSLYSKKETTHKFNHELYSKNVEINYMEELNSNIYMGHKAFEFVRCGTNPNDVFSINSNFKR
jgi:hypothetical protein